MAIAKSYVRVIAKEKFEKMDKPVLSKQAFWDVDMDKIDYEKNAGHVIQKVFDRGTLDDILAILNFYSEDKIKTTLLNARYLMNNTMSFACVLFGLKLEDFRYYKFKQLKPNVWPF
jgi:hypothetical protein